MTFPVGTLASEIDSQSAFLQTIIGTPGASIYTDFRNVSPVPSGSDPGHLGGSIYMLQPHDVADQLGVRAIYEIDLLEITETPGVFASVRRYVGAARTVSYHVFYSEASVSDFGPLFVVFEKSSRLAYPETSLDAYGVTLDSYKVGPRGPFFMMWWPDPAFILGKDGVNAAATVPTGDVKSAYHTMGAKTGMMGVVPFFPPL